MTDSQLPKLIYLANLTYQSNFSHSTQEEISSKPVIGYLGRIDQTEVGILFTPGKFVEHKDTQKAVIYNVNSNFQQAYIYEKNDIPFYFLFNPGPDLTVGIFSKILNNLAVALELDSGFPFTYSQKTLLPNTLFPVKMIRSHTNVKINPSITLRGGFGVTP